MAILDLEDLRPYVYAYTCGDCDGTMLVRTSDKTSCWECIECGRSSIDHITRSLTCESAVLGFEDGKEFSGRDLSSQLWAYNFDVIPRGFYGLSGFFRVFGDFRDASVPERCMECITCHFCERLIKDEVGWKPSHEFRFKVIRSIDDTEFSSFFFHRDCVEKSPIHRAYTDDLARLQGTSFKGSSGCGKMIAIPVIGAIGLFLGGYVWNGVNGSSSSSTSSATTMTPKRARVTKAKASLRPQPNDQSKPIAMFSKNERLELLSPNYSGRGWYNVRHPSSGMTGWIHGNNIEFVR